MNGGDQLYSGFEAEFLGDQALFGSQPARDFFPWTQSDGNVNVVGLSGVRMTDLVPSEPIGALFDDLSTFWRQMGNETHLGSCFVEIGIVGERVAVIRKGGLSDLGVDHPVTKSIVGLPPRGRDHIHLPLSLIYFGLSDLAQDRGISPEHSKMSRRQLWEIEDLLYVINGPIRRAEWKYLRWLTEFRKPLGGDEEFWRTIKKVRADVEEEELSRLRPREGVVHSDRSSDGIPLVPIDFFYQVLI
jgi:hypothetical protein